MGTHPNELDLRLTPINTLFNEPCSMPSYMYIDSVSIAALVS